MIWSFTFSRILPWSIDLTKPYSWLFVLLLPLSFDVRIDKIGHNCRSSFGSILKRREIFLFIISFLIPGAWNSWSV